MNISKLTAMSWENWQSVTLDYEDHDLELIECLRLLPGKRCAAKANWNGEVVFAKVFFNGAHRNSASLEMDYLQSLKQCEARVPSIIGVYGDEHSSVLLTEWLEEAEPLEQLIDSDETILHDAMGQVRNIYDAGYAQRDIHFGNFVVSGGKAWIVDTAALLVLSETASIRSHQISENLALLCAQVSMELADRIIPIILNDLSDYLGSDEVFRQCFIRLRNKRIKKAIKKWSRESTAIAVRMSGNTRVAYDREYASSFDTFSSWIEQPSLLPVVKEGSKISVYGNDQWIVKHYHKHGALEKIKRKFGLSHAARSWVMGWTLDMVGFPTPRPVAHAEMPDGSAVVIMPRVDGIRLAEIMESDAEQTEYYSKMAKVWIELLGQWGFWHGDLKAQNILCKDDQLFFIDLDDCGWSNNKKLSLRQHEKDKARFKKNEQQFVLSKV